MHEKQRQTPIVKDSGKRKFRILRPSEYVLLRDAAGSLENQTRLDALLLTGARYVECQRLHEHPEWLDGRFAHLPAEASRKVLRRQRERWVWLSSKGVTVLPYFFEGKQLPGWKAWERNMRRWAEKAALDPAYISAKSTRKSWESWLVYYYPNQIQAIFLSQGHTEITALKHYVNLPFTEEDRRDMKEWVEGWGQ